MRKNTGLWIINICIVLLFWNSSKLIGAEKTLGHIPPLNELLSMSIDELADIALKNDSKEFQEILDQEKKLQSKKENINKELLDYSSNKEFHEFTREDLEKMLELHYRISEIDNNFLTLNRKLYKFEPFKSLYSGENLDTWKKSYPKITELIHKLTT